jgi:hypothetical protein
MDADGKLSGVNMEGIKYYNNLINKLISEGKGYAYFLTNKKWLHILSDTKSQKQISKFNLIFSNVQVFNHSSPSFTGTPHKH